MTSGADLTEQKHARTNSRTNMKAETKSEMEPYEAKGGKDSLRFMAEL